jgi:hypothetical protein
MMGYQNPVYYGANNYWVPGWDGTSHYADIWSSKTLNGTFTKNSAYSGGTVTFGNQGYVFSGSTVYRIVAGTAAKLYYDKATLNADGSLSWGTEASLTLRSADCNAAYSTFTPSTTVDSSGNWWFTVGCQLDAQVGDSGPDYYFEVYECTNPTSCTWTYKTDYWVPSTAYYSQIVGLTAGKVALTVMKGDSTPFTIFGEDYNPSGGTWSAGATTTNSYTQPYSGFASLGSTLVGCGARYVSGSHKLYFLSLAFGASSWTETSVDTGPSVWPY